MANKHKGSYSVSRSTVLSLLAVTVLGFLFVAVIEHLSDEAVAQADPAAAFGQLQNVVALLWIPAMCLLAYAWHLFRQPGGRKPLVIGALVLLAVVPPLLITFVVNSVGSEAGL